MARTRIISGLCSFLLTCLLPIGLIGQDEKIQIGFSEFERIDEQAYFENESFGLEEVIKLGLIRYGKLDFVEIDESTSYQVNSKVNPAISEDVDVIISGQYALYEQEFVVYTRLFIPSEHRIIQVNSVIGDIQNPFPAFNALCNSIMDDLDGKWLQNSSKRKKIAIISHLSNKKGETKLGRNYLDDLTKKIIEKIPNQPNVAITGWNESSVYNFAELGNDNLAGILNVDAVLVANMELLDNNVTQVVPEFYIAETNQSFELGKINDDYFENISLADELASRARYFFQVVIESDGDWNIDPFLEQATGFREYYDLGERYFKDKMPSVSNYYYYKAQSYNDTSASLHCNMAVNYQELGRKEEAKQEYQKAISKDSNFVQAYYNLFLLYRDDFEQDKLTLLRASIPKRLENEPLIILMNAEILYLLKKYEEAIPIIIQAIEVDSENPDLFEMLGVSYQASGETQKAIDNYNMVKEKDPKNTTVDTYLYEIYYRKGQSAYYKKSIGEALEYFEMARTYSAYNFETENIINCYLELNQLSSASDYFEKYLENGYFDETSGYYHMASMIRNKLIDKDSQVYLSQEYGLKVIEYLDLHLEFSPDDAHALWLKGNTFVYLDEIQESLRYLEMAYVQDKTNKNIYLDLVESLTINAKYERSEGIYQDLMAISEGTNQIAIRDELLLRLIHIGNKVGIDGEFDKHEANYIEKQISKGTRIQGWSYKAFLKWIEGLEEPSGKEQLKVLTLFMESNTL